MSWWCPTKRMPMGNFTWTDLLPDSCPFLRCYTLKATAKGRFVSKLYLTCHPVLCNSGNASFSDKGNTLQKGFDSNIMRSDFFIINEAKLSLGSFLNYVSLLFKHLFLNILFRIYFIQSIFAWTCTSSPLPTYPLLLTRNICLISYWWSQAVWRPTMHGCGTGIFCVSHTVCRLLFPAWDNIF